MALLLWGTLVPAPAQQSLGELVEQHGAGWLIGDWTAQDDNGNPIQLTMAWELNKNMISMHRKDARWEIKGMTALDPESGKVMYVAVSSRGGTILGDWDQDNNGHPQLNLKARGRDGQSWSGLVVFKKVNADAMNVEMGSLDNPGQSYSVAFKRKK